MCGWMFMVKAGGSSCKRRAAIFEDDGADRAVISMEIAETVCMNRKSFLKGALFLSLGGFIAKALGALYRIPLTNCIGGEGIGLYQMVYPLYCLLLTISAVSIPSALSRIVSAQPRSGAVKTGLKLFSWLGLCGTLVMAVCASPLARLQGYPFLQYGYWALAPSVLCVSVISVFRGYFQGRGRMAPTAVSEVAEQLIKIAFGIFFAWYFRSDLYRAVVFVLLAVSISEGVTLLFLWRWYQKSAPLPVETPIGAGALFRQTLPLTANAALGPLFQLLDSFLIVKGLPDAGNAVAIYGLYSGCAVTLVNLPVSVCYGFAAAVVPLIAEQQGKEAKRSVLQALGITLLAALPMALALYLFPGQIARLIFRNLTAAELDTLQALVRRMAVGAFLFAGVQTLSASLTGLGQPKYAALSMLFASLVKSVFLVVCLPRMGITAAGISLNLCYLVAFFLDLYYSIKVNKEAKHDHDSGNGSARRRSDAAGCGGHSECAQDLGSDGTDAIDSMAQGLTGAVRRPGRDL